MLKEQTKMTNKLWVDVPYSVDSGIGDRAHIGMLVIDCDQTLSYECCRRYGNRSGGCWCWGACRCHLLQ